MKFIAILLFMFNGEVTPMYLGEHIGVKSCAAAIEKHVTTYKIPQEKFLGMCVEKTDV